MTTITGHKRLRKQFQESFTVSRFVELMTAATEAHEKAKIKDDITAKSYTVYTTSQILNNGLSGDVLR